MRKDWVIANDKRCEFETDGKVIIYKERRVEKKGRFWNIDGKKFKTRYSAIEHINGAA